MKHVRKTRCLVVHEHLKLKFRLTRFITCHTSLLHYPNYIRKGTIIFD